VIKAIFRSAFVQQTLALILAFYLWVVLATMRWTIENRAPADQAMTEPAGIVACFWHGRIALAVQCRHVIANKQRKVLISLSRDGEFIAKAVSMLTFGAIRGGAGGKSKGGSAAFRESLAYLKSGGLLAITPDGPRGPNQHMPVGPLMMARTARVPAFVFGLAANPAIRSKSWDKAAFPLPFTRGAVVFDGPFYVPRDADDATMEVMRADWEARLNAAQLRAEALIA